MSELWEVVEGRESDDWGVRKKGENYGKSIAQMLWEEDAREIVELHNRASLTSATAVDPRVSLWLRAYAGFRPHLWPEIKEYLETALTSATEGERDAKELAKELVYSVRGWGQRSPQFMTAMVEKWATKIEAWSWRPTAGVGAESPSLYEALRQAETILILLKPEIERLGCGAKNVLPNVQKALAARAESPSTAAKEKK